MSNFYTNSLKRQLIWNGRSISFVYLTVCPLQLLQALDSFIVVEREGHVIACSALFPFFEEKCGEVAAIAVSPECRGQGQGDKLLGM